MKTRLAVVAAVLSRIQDQVFQVALFQRRQGDLGAGLWEFPGGKIEIGETAEEALRREIKEELSLDVAVGRPVGETSFEFPERIIDLQLFWVQSPHFNWSLNDHDGAIWVTAETWPRLNVAPMDIPLIKKVFSENS